MLELNLAIIGLILSIIFSSLEIALISANKLQIDVWIKQNVKLSQLTKNILDDKPKYLIVTLIGTTLSNILCSSFCTVYLVNNDIVSSKFTFIPIVIIVLLFGELLPKTIIRQHSSIMLMLLSPLMYFFYIIFYPIVVILNNFNIFDRKETIKRKELEHLYEYAEDIKSIDKNEKEIISNIFKYSTTTVSEVMTPRTDISAISNKLNLDEAAHIFIDSGHSKLPVYEDDIDNIIGLIYLYDLYTKPINLKDIIKEVTFVPFSKLITDMMNQLKNKKHSISIVLDEHGGTAGLITLEDIFEELFGEFEDEFDYEELELKETEDGSILVNAKMEYETFNKKYGNIIPNGDYETIGGYIINKIGRIPNKNEHLFLDIGQVIIKNSSSRRIEQIQIYLNN